MKYLVLIFSLFSVCLFGQGIEPSSFQPTPYKGGVLVGKIQMIDDFTGDTVYMYQHSDTTFTSVSKVKNSPTMTLRIQSDSIRADIKKRLNAINVGGADVFLSLQIDSTGQIYGVNEIISDDFDKDQYNELQSISIDSLNRVFRITLTDGGVVKFLDRGILTETQTLSTNGTAGNIAITGSSAITLNVNDADSDPNNEYSNLYVGSSVTGLTPKDGDIWKNTTTQKIFVRKSGSWVDIADLKFDIDVSQSSNTLFVAHNLDGGGYELTINGNSGILLEGNSLGYNIGVDTNYIKALIPNAADSTVIVDGWGITSVESPTKTFNLMADSSQVFTQYDGTLKQNTLVSGTNIKTINGNSLLGSGNLTISTIDSTGVSGGYGIDVTESANVFTVKADTSELSTPFDLTLKQDKLTGANKRVPYFTGTSTLSNSDNLVFDNSTKYLGIGTASPDATIHMTQSTGNRIRFTDPSSGLNYKNWQIFAGSGADERNLSFQSLSDAGTTYDFMTWRKSTNSQVISNLYIPHLATSSGTEVMTMNNVGEVYRSGLKTINSNTLFGSGDITTESPLTFSSPLSRSGNTISLPAASTSVSGHLTSTDWNTFNNWMRPSSNSWNSEVYNNQMKPIFSNTDSPNGLFGYGFWTGHTSNSLFGAQLAITGSASFPPTLYFRTRDNGTFQSWRRAVTITGNTQYYFPKVDSNGDLELGTTFENNLYWQTGRNMHIDKSQPYFKFFRSGSDHMMMGDESAIWGTNAGSFSMFVYGNNSFNIATNSGKRLNINGSGVVNISNLAGSGTRMVTATASGDLGFADIPVIPQTFALVGSNIQSWGSTGAFGSGRDVGLGVDPTRQFDNNGDTRLRGAIYDSGNIAGSSGQVLTSQGTGAWTWTTPTDNSVTNEGFLGVNSSGTNQSLLQGYNSAGTTTGTGVTFQAQQSITMTETTSTNGGTINVGLSRPYAHLRQTGFSTTQNLSANTWTKINFENIQNSNGYTASTTNEDVTIGSNNTGVAECTFTGYFTFPTSPNTGWFEVALFKNGTQINQTTVAYLLSETGRYWSVPISWTENFSNTTDTIDVRVKSTSAMTGLVAGAANFIVQRIN